MTKDQNCLNCYFGDNYVDCNGKQLYTICRYGPPTVICHVIMMGDTSPSPAIWKQWLRSCLKQWNLFPKMKSDDFCHQYKEADVQDEYLDES